MRNTASIDMMTAASPREAALPPAGHSRKLLDFAREVRDAIDRGAVVLPTLPDVAMRVNGLLRSDQCDTTQIAHSIALDPAIAARVVVAANSAYTQGREPVDTLPAAVTRLGMQYTRALVNRIALEQMFCAHSRMLHKVATDIWLESVRVGALCEALTRFRSSTVGADEALLAGLLHLVGCLPVIRLADESPGRFDNEPGIGELIRTLQPEIGYYLLEEWGFSESISDVALATKDPMRSHGGATDVLDVVLVARKLLRLSFVNELDPDAVLPAFDRLRLEGNLTLSDLPEVEAAFEVSLQRIFG